MIKKLAIVNANAHVNLHLYSAIPRSVSTVLNTLKSRKSSKSYCCSSTDHKDCPVMSSKPPQCLQRTLLIRHLSFTR